MQSLRTSGDLIRGPRQGMWLKSSPILHGVQLSMFYSTQSTPESRTTELLVASATREVPKVTKVPLFRRTRGTQKFSSLGVSTETPFICGCTMFCYTKMSGIVWRNSLKSHVRTPEMWNQAMHLTYVISLTLPVHYVVDWSALPFRGEYLKMFV